jgi:hypothetical protein
LISLATEPERYRHWRVTYEAAIATVVMAVTPGAGPRDDYELKLNSYDRSNTVDDQRAGRTGTIVPGYEATLLDDNNEP